MRLKEISCSKKAAFLKFNCCNSNSSESPSEVSFVVSSVTKVMSSSLQLQRLQHARLLCPPLSLCLLRCMSTELVMLSNHLILCCPLLLLPSISPNIGVFSKEVSLLTTYQEVSISFSEQCSTLARLLCPWISLGKGIFTSERSNPGLPHHRRGSLPSSEPLGKLTLRITKKTLCDLCSCICCTTTYLS